MSNTVLFTVQLEDALKHWSISGHEAVLQRTKVVDLLARLEILAEKAIEQLKANDPKYFKAFEPLLNTDFWTLDPVWKETDPKLVYLKSRATECFPEDISDKCMTQLLGTWNDYGLPCLVSSTCRNLMTAFGCPDYSISHQLLYFLIAELKKCSNVLGAQRRRESHVSFIVQDYKTIFCSNIMQRNLQIEDNDFPLHLHDLFVENIMVCGLAGFSEFYETRWLENILTWQETTDGCFGKSMKEPYKLTEHKRVKRREKLLKGGCSSHMTAVAVAALGGYLRFYGTRQNITVI
uniref:Uncharacterized protein n=1 Tax=Callorhinchus milii TaxID=7868 RepID=A0A4W3IAN6_CALMI